MTPMTANDKVVLVLSLFQRGLINIDEAALLLESPGYSVFPYRVLQYFPDPLYPVYSTGTKYLGDTSSSSLIQGGN